MTENKFRAVLTVFNKDKILELRIDGLSGLKLEYKQSPT